MMRLDLYLFANGYASSRQRAQAMIKNGDVTIDASVVTKPSFVIADNTRPVIQIKENSNRFVSRGGLKLSAALTHFGLDVKGKIAVDIGASTGGFTDCLLQNGAERVYCIDVGESQLHESLKKDQRVVIMDHCNARFLSCEQFPVLPSIAVMDVSFISQTLILPAIKGVISDDGILVSLIKPQFEVGPAHLSKKGIVIDERPRLEAVRTVLSAARQAGFYPNDLMHSPIEGGDGNHEYLFCASCQCSMQIEKPLETISDLKKILNQNGG